MSRSTLTTSGGLLTLALTGFNLFAQVPYRRLVNADQEPANWLTYSGDYQAHRFSRLTQITRRNVARIKMAWVHQVRQSGYVEMTPLVADGVMYVTEPPSTVTALDVRSGRPIWTYSPTIPPNTITIGSIAPVNRGVAILDETVFVGTVTGHLIALDARSGAVRWDTVVEDNRRAYFLTLAPLALDGRIIVGVSGGEAGIRGFIDGYEAKSGKRLWRTWSIPAPGEPGSQTWKGNSWQTGGGATWLTGSFDPDLNLVYWGTGNPSPDYNGDVRPGDNLYTCSLLALNPVDGKIKWFFQFSPHDTHDWDSNQIPVLFDATVGGRARKIVAVANRNAFYYLLDRETGEFISAQPYAKQTWASGLDAKGRPIVKPGTESNAEGVFVYPSLIGASNWQSPSYSPQTKLFYQAVKEMGSIYVKGEAQYQVGRGFGGGRARVVSEDAFGAIRALDATSGKLQWEFKMLSPAWTSLLSTAGGLLFGGSEEGNFFALDADTGAPLWDVQLGGAMRSGGPISFAVDGKQYVSVSAGYAVFAFALP
jgi:alcohol dehydrogenase (cytochrome c)